jgi:acyl-CoA dehydrogenase family protein 9
MDDQSFLKAMFHGVIAEDLVFPFPEISADQRESTALMLDSVRRFLDGIDSVAIDRNEEIPPEVLAGAKALGLYGLQIPTEYGGLGLCAAAYARMMQEIAARDGSLAVTLGAHQSIGLKGILLFGTEDQKKRYLPKLATGEWTAAFALTEPGAGSDAASIHTRAELSPDGRHYILNGSKIWTTNGGFADIFTIFARTSALEEGNRPKITAFIVERQMGIVNGLNEHKLGIRGSSTTAIFMDNVMVPRENVIGEVGKGFKVAMEVLNDGRLGLAAGSVGTSKTLLKLALDRVQERRAFGRNIGDFELIKDKVAEMLSRIYALESMTYLTAGLVELKTADASLESAICKVMGSETLWYVVNETLQIAAGIGYMQDYPYERILRDARINLIFEGTNEVLRCFIALSGMHGPGEALAEVVKAMREPIKGFGLLRDFAIRKARTVLGRERIMTRSHPLLSREAVVFEEYTGELAARVEAALRKYGRDIAEMQYVQRRIADMAIDLYAIAACISRTTRAIERKGDEGARREVDLTTTFVASAHQRLRQNVANFEQNDDELRKSIAARAYVDGAYPFDIL